jgi:PRC-barrel domain
VTTLDPRDENPRTHGREPEYGATAAASGTPVGTPPPAGRASYPSTEYSSTERAFNAWNYRPDAGWRADFDLVGYHVEATDGRIGKIDEDSNATDASYLVVDTGPWILGKKVMIPAGTVTHIDHTDRKVYVDRTKEQVKSSPEFDQDMYTDAAYRDKVGGYYDDTYRRPMR